MFRILLHSSVRKAALLAGLMLPGAVYCYWSLRISAAEHFATQNTEAGIRRALQLQPRNADYHYQLGRALFLLDGDWNGAASELRRAVELNPREAHYWLELSSTQNVLGAVAQQDFALKKALEMDPTTPDVAWEAANLYLVSGESLKSLKLFHVVVENDPINAPRAIELAWRSTKDVNILLEHTVPNTARANSTFLSILTANDEVSAAQRVWERLVALNNTVDRLAALNYIDLLVSKQESATAARSWEQLAVLDPEIGNYRTGNNLIVNPSFEHPILNGGLDWHWVKWDQRFKPSTDSSQAHASSLSISIEANARSVDDFGLLQYVPVNPDTSYHFRGYMRAEELLTASGPRFVIRDAASNLPLLVTNEVIGTAQWQDYSGEFKTGPETRLLKIQVQRLPGDQVISGRFWVDDLELIAR